MSECGPITGCCYQGSTVSLMARVEADGVLINRAAVASIAYQVFDLCDTAEPVASGSVAVADSVYDELQTDDRWSEDSVGYNFRHDVPGSVQSVGDSICRYEYRVTLVSGAVFALRPFDVTITPTLS